MAKSLDMYRKHQHKWATSSICTAQYDNPPSAGSGDRNIIYYGKEASSALAARLNVTGTHAVTQAIHEANVTEHAYVESIYFQPFVYNYNYNYL